MVDLAARFLECFSRTSTRLPTLNIEATIVPFLAYAPCGPLSTVQGFFSCGLNPNLIGATEPSERTFFPPNLRETAMGLACMLASTAGTTDRRRPLPPPVSKAPCLAVRDFRCSANAVSPSERQHSPLMILAKPPSVAVCDRRGVFLRLRFLYPSRRKTSSPTALGEAGRISACFVWTGEYHP